MVDLEVVCPVYDSFRVQQVGGMFDVPIAERAAQRFRVEVPAWLSEDATSAGDAGDWALGLIVGPSGSGKTTVARRLFGGRLYERQPWPEEAAVVDGLGSRPIKEITGLFTAVGFSSPPSWIKPYRVLSNGEQFRCDLARALVGEGRWEAGDGGREAGRAECKIQITDGVSQKDFFTTDRSCPSLAPLVVFDEFTSVVDRNVARAVSAAIAKGIRGGRLACRFVAVTCHYDVQPWLEPDWVIDMATSTFSRRRLRRPPIRLEIFRCGRGAWPLFARHHYLSGALPRFARCFVALWEGVPVTFCATVSLIGHQRHWRISRIVTLPDYQGLGIGMRVAEAIAELHVREGNRMNVTASHPALIAHCRRSPQWRTVGVRKCGSLRSREFIGNYRGSAGRAVVSFEYLGLRGKDAAGAGGLPGGVAIA